MSGPKLHGMATVVHGPQGCGKTTNAKRIMDAYGLHTLVDGWDGQGALQEGHLYLTNDEQIDRKLSGRQFGIPIRIVNFRVAMEMVKIDEESRA